MKKILILVLALMLTFGAFACSSTPAPAAEPAAEAATEPAQAAEPAAEPATADQPYVILVNALVGHPVYEQQAEAARKAAEEYGVKLEIIGPTQHLTDEDVDSVDPVTHHVHDGTEHICASREVGVGAGRDRLVEEA